VHFFIKLMCRDILTAPVCGADESYSVAQRGICNILFTSNGTNMRHKLNIDLHDRLHTLWLGIT